MRYIRKQIVITTVDDVDLRDKPVIVKLLQNICESSVDINISYSKSGVLRTYDKCRIVKVNDDSIDIKAFYNKGIVNDTNIALNDIMSIVMQTYKNAIKVGDEQINNFSFLDIDDTFGDKKH